MYSRGVGLTAGSSFFFIFGSFREIYTRYYERHKADVSCFFYLEVLTALYFERGLLNMSLTIPIQNDQKRLT